MFLSFESTKSSSFNSIEKKLEQISSKQHGRTDLEFDWHQHNILMINIIDFQYMRDTFCEFSNIKMFNTFVPFKLLWYKILWLTEADMIYTYRWLVWYMLIISTNFINCQKCQNTHFLFEHYQLMYNFIQSPGLLLF